MALPYSGSASLHAFISLPSDGDPAIAESVNVALRALKDTNVYNTTANSHQMMDDRGKTSTLTGTVTINNGDGDIVYNVPFRMNASVDIYSDVSIHTGNPFTCDGPGTFNHDLDVGTDDADTLRVNASADFQAPVDFHNDVQLGHDDDAVTVDATVDFNNTVDFHNDVQIGHSDDVVTIGAPLTVTEATRITSDLRVDGGSQLGNSGSDEHHVNGSWTANNDATVEGDFNVQGDAAFEDDVTIAGGLTVTSSASFKRNVTLGDSSGDSVTFNALIASPVGFTSVGRIGFRYATGPTTSQSFTAASGNLIGVASLDGDATYTIDPSLDGDGDFILFLNFQTSRQLTIRAPGSSDCVLASGTRKACLAIRTGPGAWQTATWAIGVFS
jgi:hypothetical protein